MINDFKALIAKRGGLSKTNRFDVIMTLPIGIDVDDRGRDLTLLCESASLPGKQITTVEYALFGHNRKVPSGFIQEDVTLSFNITNDYYVKTIFDKWQALVIDLSTYGLAWDSDYQTDIQLRQLDENDEPVWTTTLIGAYPITVNSIQLDNNSDSTTQKLSVTISYTDFKR